MKAVKINFHRADGKLSALNLNTMAYINDVQEAQFLQFDPPAADCVVYYFTKIHAMDKMKWQTEKDLVIRDGWVAKKRKAINAFLTSPLGGPGPRVSNFFKQN